MKGKIEEKSSYICWQTVLMTLYRHNTRITIINILIIIIINKKIILIIVNRNTIKIVNKNTIKISETIIDIIVIKKVNNIFYIKIIMSFGK